VDSLLSHFANSSDNRRTSSTDIPLPVFEETPERELLEKERSSEADQILSEIILRSQDDTVVLEIIESMRNGALTRREIVQATHRPIDVVDNALKRLRRLGANVVRSNKRYETETAK
jgi:hypothetical protein